MQFEQFFESVAAANIAIEITDKPDSPRNFLSNEALFQLPLIALVILALAKDRRKPRISEIGQMVGECIEKSVYGFKGTTHNFGWSGNLRIRTVTAVRFLELSKLIIIEERTSRIEATELGKKIINSAISSESDLSLCIQGITRAYRNLSIEKQFEMELL
jgi:hypothetical protein